MPDIHPPLVSVVIPVYNGARYLADAIRSVLAQDHRPIQVVVVDDGSTDDSADVAAAFAPDVECHRQPNQGAAAARNLGVTLAHGALLTFLDADDVWMPGKLRRQVDAMASHPHLDLVLGHVRQVIVGATKGGAVQAPAQPGYVPGALLMRREAFDRVGPFDTRWRVGEFIDWHARAVELGLQEMTLPEVVLERRIHDSNLGRREPENRVDYVRVVKAALDRRRRALDFPDPRP